MLSWIFGCLFGYEQSTCGEAREYDAQARGAGKWGGCPSCKHREPANAKTMRAEDYHHANAKQARSKN